MSAHIRVRVSVTGVVQGVGFRPTVARIAAAAKGEDPYGYRAEFVQLVRTVIELVDAVDRAIAAFRAVAARSRSGSAARAP